MKYKQQPHAQKPGKSPHDLRDLLRDMPELATAEQIGSVLQVSDRQVHLWAQKNLIPTALRKGRIVRYNPLAVAQALGVDLG